MDAPVPAQDLSIAVNEASGGRLEIWTHLPYEPLIVVVGDKADLLAVPEGPVTKTEVQGLRADFLFCFVTVGEENVLEFLLSEHEEEVGLVLAGVNAPAERVSPGISIVGLAGVVARGDQIEAQFTGLVEQVMILIFLLQTQQGLGVLPARYSETK